MRRSAPSTGTADSPAYGDDGVVTRPCCASQSVTLIDPTHKPTGMAMGPLGSPVSVALPVKLAYMGVPWRVRKSVRLGKYFRTSLYFWSVLTWGRSAPCVGCGGCPGRLRGAPLRVATTSVSILSLYLGLRTCSFQFSFTAVYTSYSYLFIESSGG